MLSVITNRGMSDELILVNTSDLSVLAIYPPLIPQEAVPNAPVPSEVQP
jgi:hypothetical protein